MNSKIFGFLAVLLLISIIPSSYAQISVGEKAIQKSVGVNIDSEGNVHVKHVVRSSNLPTDLELVYGTVSNISVTNEQGDELLFSTSNDNSMVLVQPSDEESIVEYDLEHVLTQKNNVWTWSFRYFEKTNFYFSDNVEMIFVDERPVLFNDKKGIACHGCEMVLEFSIDEPTIFENVKWEDEEFTVEIKSNLDVENFVFDQPTKSITFDVSQENNFVTTIIPLELLWGPYSVFLGDEKIFFNSYINNGTHVWLTMKPESSGEIMIVGTTVIPEFPIIAPLALGFLMILVIPLVRKVNLH